MTDILLYRDPEDTSRYKDRLEYYLWLAKLADKGKITAIFFADGYGVMQVRLPALISSSLIGGTDIDNRPMKESLMLSIEEDQWSVTWIQ